MQYNYLSIWKYLSNCAAVFYKYIVLPYIAAMAYKYLRILI